MDNEERATFQQVRDLEAVSHTLTPTQAGILLKTSAHIAAENAQLRARVKALEGALAAVVNMEEVTGILRRLHRANIAPKWANKSYWCHSCDRFPSKRPLVGDDSWHAPDCAWVAAGRWLTEHDPTHAPH